MECVTVNTEWKEFKHYVILGQCLNNNWNIS
jgi:hypothetical protein